MRAQAMLEKGALDSMAAGFSDLARDVTYSLQDKPWLWAVFAVGIVLILMRHKR